MVTRELDEFTKDQRIHKEDSDDASILTARLQDKSQTTEEPLKFRQWFDSAFSLCIICCHERENIFKTSSMKQPTTRAAPWMKHRGCPSSRCRFTNGRSQLTVKPHSYKPLELEYSIFQTVYKGLNMNLRDICMHIPCTKFASCCQEAHHSNTSKQ